VGGGFTFGAQKKTGFAEKTAGTLSGGYIKKEFNAREKNGEDTRETRGK